MLTDMITGARQTLGLLTKKSLDSFNMLETIADEYSFIAKDGSMATIVRIDGFKNLMGEEELQTVIRDLTLKLTPYLRAAGHIMQIWFARDPEIARDVIHASNRPAMSTAHALSMNLDDVFLEREENLSKFIAWEGFYFVLWTKTTILTSQELASWRQEVAVPKGSPTFRDAQSLYKYSHRMLIKHESFAKNIVIDLKNIGIRSKIIRAHNALKAMRAAIYPDQLESLWSPSLPGDPIRAQEPEISQIDASHIFYRDLDSQIFDREAEHINPRIIRIGHYYMGGLDMIQGPRHIEPFSHLMQRMNQGIESRFPWRVSFLIEGGGGTPGALEDVLLAIFANFGAHNKMLARVSDELRSLSQQNEVITRLRISFATWSKATPEGVIRLEERLSQLQRNVESWGAPRLSPLAGDPVEGVLSSTLGLHAASTAPTARAPLTDVVTMLPWDRDNSPWDKGAVLFRTEDGRLWPYQPGSDKQATWIDLIFAPPGRGKSVFLNTLNLALCLSPVATKGTHGANLPRVAIIDIGHSSSGLVSLIRESLPDASKHQVVYKKLKMIAEHAINPFDTQLGCRQPLPSERSFLRNFLTALCTPENKEIPHMLSDLADMVIDEAYRQYDDSILNSKPKLYEEHVDQDVDDALRHYHITLPEHPTWWEVVDAFFNKGAWRHAVLAQRQAVPQISDLSDTLACEHIENTYGRTRLDNGERLVDFFNTTLTAALNTYKLLTRPTQFDIGNARICSLNLEEVAHGKKQTGIVYMLGRFSLAKDYYMGMDDIALVPKAYRDYHRDRVKNLKEIPKRIVYDEFHRTYGVHSVRNQVITDMREGRKYGVHIALCSQLPEDFDSAMVDIASGVWIMGADTKQSMEKVKTIFGLSATASNVLQTKLVKPTFKGAPFLALLQLDDGRHEHLLYNTLGSTELWAFSTTAEDVYLRDELYSRLGAQRARRVLARRFPGGSAREEITRRVDRLAETGQTEHMGKVIEELIDELCAGAFQ